MEYVNEAELKSLIIRINNFDKGIQTYSETDLKKLNKYILKIKSKIKNQKYKRIMRNYIIKISERNCIDPQSFETFGEVLMLIIKNMLKKPNFSGYTYRDEFYSDTYYKVLKYLKNFNHLLISKRSGQAVSAFAYISQIVKNSFIFIIEQKKSENIKLRNIISLESSEKLENINESTYESEKISNTAVIVIHELKTNLYNTLVELLDAHKQSDYSLEFEYPIDYKISLEEYENIIKLNTIYKKNIILRRQYDRTRIIEETI